MSLSQNIFFTMVYVSWVVSHLKFRFPDHFCLNVTLSRLISLFMLVVFLHIFVWAFLMRMLYLQNTYHVQSVYFSGIQESMIYVVDRNQILFDVTSSDHVVHSNSIMNGIQLEY